MAPCQITLIPGDGIGPEVADATVRAVDATGVAIEWERVEAGVRALAEYGQLIPDEVFASLEVTRVGLKGPTATPIAGGHQSINVALRKKLGLYTNFRPVRMLPGLKTRFHDLPARPGHLPREHRRPLLRPGARSGARAWWRASRSSPATPP